MTVTKQDDDTKPTLNNDLEELVRQGKAYRTERHGVWDIMFMDEGFRRQFKRLLQDFPKSIPSLRQLVQEIYSVSPSLFLLFCVSQVWNNCQGAVSLHFTSELLRVLEFCLREGISDYWTIAYSVSLKLIAIALAGCVSWYNERTLSRMRRKIISHFELRLIKAKLTHDLAKAGSAAHQINVSSDQAWHAFEEILQFIGWGIDAMSQLTLIFHISHRSAGPLFALLCVIKPLVSTLCRRSLWDKICVVKQTNQHQIRMEALTALTGNQYRQDVISGDLRDYIVAEYQTASTVMSEISDEDPWTLYEQFRSPLPDIIINILGDLPIVYCAFLALTRPQQVSFAYIAILQESSSSMGWSIEVLLKGTERFRKSLKRIRELYEVAQVSPITVKGDDGCPLVDVNAVTLANEGMGFEFRDVSFTYPGSQTNTLALSNINLTVKPGQFVVLVGANGSGKSTLVKLLARLYQPPNDDDDDSDNDKPQVGPGSTTGDILIDSIPSSSYSDSYLRQSMAILSQDNLIYPGFSLGENIGMGYTPLLSDTDATLEAAKKAGAEEVLKRMKDGTNTVLDPMLTHYDINVRAQEKGHPLKEVLKELRRPVDVSGGERQRIVAARTFMRFKSGKIRFLAVDEPSSALDAEAEATLLENLLKERDGKTIIFVTHRFGKLTRQADMIVCMKEGKIMESGTHTELMNVNGEYKKLYDIQAKAFQDDAAIEKARVEGAR